MPPPRWPDPAAEWRRWWHEAFAASREVGAVGWSGYHVGCEVAVTVDAHGGPEEMRQEALYTELRARLIAAVEAIAGEPQYACLSPHLL